MDKIPTCEDYEIAIDEPRLIKCTRLSGGHVEKNADDVVIRYVGGFCIVFPFYLSNEDKVAVRCWTTYINDIRERAHIVAQELQKLKLPYFVKFEYFEDGIATAVGTQPIIVMDWVNAMPLKEYLEKNLYNKEILNNLATCFLSMVIDFHNVGISHGDLQHGNILVKEDGAIVLVDYDSIYVSALGNVPDDIKGLAGYQHPARWKNRYASLKADYFSELIIYTSIKALIFFPSLWNELNIAETETLLFSEEDICSKGTSNIFRTLESNSEIKPLVEEIERELYFDDIDELQPLEMAIKPIVERVSSGIRDKWNKTPNSPSNLFEPNTSDIRGKWNNL